MTLAEVVDIFLMLIQIRCRWMLLGTKKFIDLVVGMKSRIRLMIWSSEVKLLYAWWWGRVCSQKEMNMLTTSLNDRRCYWSVWDQLVTLPAETGAQSHLRRGVMGNFRYRSWRQLRPVTTLITVAEREYVCRMVCTQCSTLMPLQCYVIPVSG